MHAHAFSQSSFFFQTLFKDATLQSSSAQLHAKWKDVSIRYFNFYEEKLLLFMFIIQPIEYYSQNYHILDYL